MNDFNLPIDPMTGSRAGLFQLGRRVGEGGSGVVYVGERVEGFTQTVAVKLLLDVGPEAVRRFQMEKESLAALPHPGIVPLIDAGVTEAGIPYLVMDLVDGKTLDGYCEAAKPDLESRLRLMIRILNAIGYAHRRLIAHCDLKSTNVLVTDDGEPHLLDFGIAKLLNPSQLGFAGPVTQSFRPLTPEFASPEQLRGEPLSTATDIYSAGVILYSLLTGQHPFERLVTRPVELLEAICSQQPEAPSRRAATSAAPPCEPRLLKGDLDAIALKALGKTPDERYRSAVDFAADLERYLSGLPVDARQGTFLYRAVKFARRRRGLAATAALATFAVAGGVSGTAWEAYQARQSKIRAQARFDDIHRLANTLLADFYDKVAKLPGATNAQKILVTHAIQYLDQLASDTPGGSLALELAEGYTKMGLLQGSPYEANLGQPGEALTTLVKAQTLAEPQAKVLPRDAHAFLILAQTMTARADVLSGMGRMSDAVAQAREAAALTDRLTAAQPSNFDAAMLSAICHESLGDKLGSSQSGAEREQAKGEFNRALELLRSTVLLDPTATRPARAVAILSMKLADELARTDLAAAAERYLEASHLLEQLPAKTQDELPTRRLRGSLSRRLGETYTELAAYDKARTYLDRSLQVSDSIVSIDPLNGSAYWDEAVALHALADLEERQHRLPEALHWVMRITSLMPKMPGLAESSNLQLSLAETLLQQANLKQQLHQPMEDLELDAQRGLAMARTVAGRRGASPEDLTRIGVMFLDAEPTGLRNPQFALDCFKQAAAASSPGGAPVPEVARLIAKAESRLGHRSQ